ncbi:hypothetical protein HY947_02335 [Candidatus Gottesmanbacteria bacterium]|nr:hypothetical protein [Candidatus Gottesmanbacteria bacterium]
MLQIPFIEEPPLLSPPVSKIQYLSRFSIGPKGKMFIYAVILFAGFFGAQILFPFLPKRSVAEPQFREVAQKEVLNATPSATSLQARAAQSNDYLLSFKDISRFDSITELHLLQKSTGNEKTLGNVSAYSPETSAALLSYPPRVVFLRESGGTKNEEYSPLNSALVVYAILSDSFTSTLTLADMKARYPNLDIPRNNAALNTLLVSPSGNRVAFNYGSPLEPDYGSDILVVNLQSGKMTIIGEKGKLKQWVNDVLLRYEMIDSLGASKSLDSLSSKVSRDVGVPY